MTKHWLEKLLGILLIGFLFFSRFFYLNQIPATLTHDEMVYAIQAKSFALQGTTLDQRQHFWDLKPVHIMYAEWPAQVMTLGMLVSHNPLVSAHLVSALMGVTLPILLAWLTWNIWRQKDAALAVFAVMVFSPLFWQMSRISYDSFFSVWFYVLAGALLTTKKRSWMLASIPVFIVGFFQYQGFKLLLVPWIGFLLLLQMSQESWQWKKVKSHLWEYKYQLAILLIGGVLMLLYGLVLLPNQGASSRLSHVIFTDETALAETVNTERRLSLNNPFTQFASNKAITIGNFMLERLLGVFDPNMLLMIIEPNVSGFSVWTHGVFYWVEMGLFLAGIGGLLAHRKTRWSGVLLLVGLLTFCLPALINSGSEWYLLRSMFSYLILTWIAGWGLAFVWHQKFIRWLVVAVYMVNILNFSYDYWFRYPIISLDWGNFDERVLAHYIDLSQQANPDLPVIVYGDEPEYDYWSYLFYNGKLTKETKDEIAESMQQYQPYVSNEAEYALGNVTFSSFCAPHDAVGMYRDVEQSPGIIIVRRNHKTCAISEEQKKSEEAAALLPKVEGLNEWQMPVLSISAVLDSGGRMEIYGDEICHDLATTYVDLKSLNQLNIESQSKNVFCGNWIKNLGLVR